MKKIIICFVLFAGAASLFADPVHVLVWDERQGRQKQAYDNFLGNEIIAQLKDAEGLEFRSAAMDDPEQGLSDANLDWADVLVWWGHVRQGEIKPETARDKIVKRILLGKLDFIVLHSAHFATPFMEAMNERTRIETEKRYPTKPKKGRRWKVEYVPPPGRVVPANDSLVTPAFYALKNGKVRVDLPNCCFPEYNPGAGASTVNVVKPDHPIARGLPKSFQIPKTEMYNEPFHVPEPDEVILEERWKNDKWFRSGMVWTLGKGKVFYFRPGHETFPIFKQPEIIKVIENACRWLGEAK